MAKRTFLLFEDSGGDTEDEARRSSINPVGDVMWLDSLKNGRRVRKPSSTPRFKIAPPLPQVEDMPWCGMAYVVSKRFRKFLAQEAPGHAQYFEAEVTGAKKSLEKLAPALPYSVVNWLHLVDCINLKKSEYDIDEEPGEQPDYTFYRLVLDPKKVPDDVLIFRLKHDETTVVIDARLARKITDAGITGPQFNKIGGIADAMGL